MKVNAIIYVSTSKINDKGRLIDAGVSGISGFVEEHQHLFNKEFELKQTPLHHKVIDVKYWNEYPELNETKDTMTENFYDSVDSVLNEMRLSSYQKTRSLTVAVVHDKYKCIDIPFFPIESINEAKNYRDKMNEEIEESGAYAFFHMAGPIVASSNGDSKFCLNDSEMILLTHLFMTIYNFEDSFKNTNTISYKDFLNQCEHQD
jgi:hypothetical protein